MCGRKRKYLSFIDVSFAESVFGQAETDCARFLDVRWYLVGLRIKKERGGRENENREEITSSLCQKVLSGLSLLPYSHLYRNIEHIALIV